MVVTTVTPAALEAAPELGPGVVPLDVHPASTRTAEAYPDVQAVLYRPGLGAASTMPSMIEVRRAAAVGQAGALASEARSISSSAARSCASSDLTRPSLDPLN